MENKNQKSMSWLNTNSGGALVPEPEFSLNKKKKKKSFTSLNGLMDRVKVYHYKKAVDEKCCENCKFMMANKACEKFLQLGVQPVRVENNYVCDLFDKNPNKQVNKVTDFEKEYELLDPNTKSFSPPHVKGGSPFEGRKSLVVLSKGIEGENKEPTPKKTETSKPQKSEPAQSTKTESAPPTTAKVKLPPSFLGQGTIKPKAPKIKKERMLEVPKKESKKEGESNFDLDVPEYSDNEMLGETENHEQLLNNNERNTGELSESFRDMQKDAKPKLKLTDPRKPTHKYSTEIKYPKSEELLQSMDNQGYWEPSVFSPDVYREYDEQHNLSPGTTIDLIRNRTKKEKFKEFDPKDPHASIGWVGNTGIRIDGNGEVQMPLNYHTDRLLRQYNHRFYTNVEIGRMLDEKNRIAKKLQDLEKDDNTYRELKSAVENGDVSARSAIRDYLLENGIITQ